MAIVIFALVCCAFYACNDDEEKDPIPELPVNEETTGEVSFSINSDGGSGTGSSSSPAVVNGDTLDMAISQKSSYTDPNGSVYTCEPKATIKLFAKVDTLYVKDLQTLLSVKDSLNQEKQTDKTGYVQHQTTQVFDIGGQAITFDLGYEVYSYVNSLQKNIEMPYVKVNPAKYGSVQSKETEKTRGSATAAVQGIRLKRLGSVTRGITVTTSEAYEVNVSFNLDISSVNTKNDTSQSLSFEVTYVGIVKTSTELPDPTMDFTYHLDVLGGTHNSTSPFALITGETLALQWIAKSQYSYFSPSTLEQQVILYEPKVTMNLSATKDTIWIDHVEDLDNVSPVQSEVATSGDNPAVTHGKSIFTLGKQNLTLNWSYEAYADLNAEGESVKMPYLQLSEPQIISVAKQALDDATISGKKAKVYEVTATLSQELTSVNASNPISETIVYVVKYTAMMEVKLVKVTYRKAWDWVEAHDNMKLASYAKVYRDRTYSTGETFTDMFSNYGHFPDWARSIDPSALEGQEVMWDDNKISYSYMTNTSIGDSIYISTQSIGVPDISKVCFLEYTDRGYGEFPSPGTWDAYHLEKSYVNQDISLQNIEVNGADNISSQPSGWYWWEIAYDNGVVLYYNDQEWPYWEWGYFLSFLLRGGFVDEYLVLDGHMFTFLEYRGPFNFDYREEPITMPNGKPAKVITFDVHNTYLGKNFYGAIVDTVYQNK